MPPQLDDHGRNRLSGHGYTVHACALRPLSRGRLPRLIGGNTNAPVMMIAEQLADMLTAQH